jgi:hypothetical protein
MYSVMATRHPRIVMLKLVAVATVAGLVPAVLNVPI